MHHSPNRVVEVVSVSTGFSHSKALIERSVVMHVTIDSGRGVVCTLLYIRCAFASTDTATIHEKPGAIFSFGVQTTWAIARSFAIPALRDFSPDALVCSFFNAMFSIAQTIHVRKLDSLRCLAFTGSIGRYPKTT